MDKPLMLLTKIMLALWALITVPGGLLVIFYGPFATSIVWPPPLAAIPTFHAQLYAAIAIGTGVGSLVVLRQNRWGSAQSMIALYFANAVFAEYAAFAQVAAGPVPFQVWFYIILGVFYLVSIVVIWRGQ